MEGGQKIKLGRNEGRGAGLVVGVGEPGRVLLGAVCRSGAGTGEPGRCCPARRGGGQKNKGKHRFVQAFLILHIAGEPFYGYAENAGKYDKFIIGYKA